MMAGGRLSFDRLPWCTGRVLGRAFLSPQVAERTRLPRERASEVPRHARLGNGENHAETQLDRQSAACWWVARHPTFTYLGVSTAELSFTSTPAELRGPQPCPQCFWRRPGFSP